MKNYFEIKKSSQPLTLVLKTNIVLVLHIKYLCLLNKWNVLSSGKFFLLSVSAWNDTLPIGDLGYTGPTCQIHTNAHCIQCMCSLPLIESQLKD